MNPTARMEPLLHRVEFLAGAIVEHCLERVMKEYLAQFLMRCRIILLCRVFNSKHLLA